MADHSRRRTRVLAALLLAALTLPSAGCLWVAGGAAAGAAVAGYAYWRGRVAREYPSPLPQTIAATQGALADLHLAILEQDHQPESASFESQTADDRKIQIDVAALPRKLPTDPSNTRVTVRVGLTGDDEVSQRILDQIAARLANPAPVVTVPPPTASFPSGPVPVTPAIGTAGPAPASTTGRLVPQPATTPPAPPKPLATTGTTPTWTPAATTEPPRAR
jgi:hypothetical protein